MKWKQIVLSNKNYYFIPEDIFKQNISLITESSYFPHFYSIGLYETVEGFNPSVRKNKIRKSESIINTFFIVEIKNVTYWDLEVVE